MDEAAALIEELAGAAGGASAAAAVGGAAAAREFVLSVGCGPSAQPAQSTERPSKVARNVEFRQFICGHRNSDEVRLGRETPGKAAG